MEPPDARVVAIGDSRATADITLRRTVLRGTAMGRGLRHLHLKGIRLCVLLTPLFRRDRRSVRRMMGPPRKGRKSAIADNPCLPPWIWEGQFLRMGEDRVVALETDAAANLARFRWLGNYNLPSGKQE